MTAVQLWTRLRSNWFAIGYRCWRKGHRWTEQHVAGVTLTYCEHCGHFRGYRRTAHARRFERRRAIEDLVFADRADANGRT